MIAALLAASGAVVEALPVVRDDEGAHRSALEVGLATDVLVTSGGVSMGPHDLVRRIAAELGVEEVFWGVAVKPGKPLSFGVRGETLVFGLPGNPVSSLVGALVFVRPALDALQGVADPGPVFQVGQREVGDPPQCSPRRVHSSPPRGERARESVLQPVTGQESHMIVRAASAEALVHVPCGDGEIAAGGTVRYLDLV